MKIILSPAKKMITDTDSIAPDGLPEFIEKTTEIQSWLKSKSKEELKTIWKCNDKITEQNFNRLENMDLYHLLTPAFGRPSSSTTVPLTGKSGIASALVAFLEKLISILCFLSLLPL